jgi:hypothetical protein
MAFSFARAYRIPAPDNTTAVTAATTRLVTPPRRARMTRDGDFIVAKP